MGQRTRRLDKAFTRPKRWVRPTSVESAQHFPRLSAPGARSPSSKRAGATALALTSPLSRCSRIDGTRYPSFKVPRTFEGRSLVRGVLSQGGRIVTFSLQMRHIFAIGSPVGG